MSLRSSCLLPALAFLSAAVSFGCASGTEVRIENASTVDFTDVSVAGRSFGDIAAGATSEYERVELNLRYAALELTAAGKRITGQTLNLGGERFTYRIDIADLAAGHLAIDVVPE